MLRHAGVALRLPAGSESPVAVIQVPQGLPQGPQGQQPELLLSEALLVPLLQLLVWLPMRPESRPLPRRLLCLQLHWRPLLCLLPELLRQSLLLVPLLLQ